MAVEVKWGWRGEGGDDGGGCRGRASVSLQHMRSSLPAPRPLAPNLQELKEKCHPLGMFENVERLAVAQNMGELFDLVLRDTPLGPYFSASLTSEDLDEMNLEILRNTLYKAYLDDFAAVCAKLGGATQEIMSEMMEFEVGGRG